MMSSWPLVVILVKDIHTDPCCYMARDPDMALRNSMGWRFNYVLRWQEWLLTNHSSPLTFNPLHNAQTIILLLLSYLSTTPLHIVMQVVHAAAGPLDVPCLYLVLKYLYIFTCNCG